MIIFVLKDEPGDTSPSESTESKLVSLGDVKIDIRKVCQVIVPDKFLHFSSILKNANENEDPVRLFISANDVKLAKQWWFKLDKLNKVLPTINSYFDIPKLANLLEISKLSVYENISDKFKDSILGDFCKTIRKVISEPIPVISLDRTKHNTKSSLWIVLAGFVFDVTSFVTSHPGGDEILQGSLSRCHDAISLFQTWHYSDASFKILSKYLIGRIKKTPYFSPTIEFSDPLESKAVSQIHKVIFSTFPKLPTS